MWEYGPNGFVLVSVDPYQLYQQIPLQAPEVPPLILNGPNVPSPLDPPPGPTFDERYPPEGTFPPQNDPFADRFYFGMESFTHGSDSRADGGRLGNYYSHDYFF